MVKPEDCIVFLETVQSGTMKTLVEVLKDVLKECSIVVNASGLSVMSMSHNKCSIVFLKLDASSFEDFRCDEEVHLGVEMLELFRLMKTVTNQDVLSLYVLKHNSDKLGIEIDNADKKTKTVFSLNLKPLDYHHFEIDDIDFKSVITMPSAYFQSLMRNMNQIADYVTIHSEGDKLSFHCQGDMASQTTEVCEADTAGTSFPNATNEAIRATYALKYLTTFTKATALCNTMQLLMKADCPMLILMYSVGTLGEIRLCLSSSIEDTM